MKVMMSGYQAVSILRGGPRTQITQTMKYLGDCGIDARLFDPWKPFSRGDADAVHVFAANIGTYHFAREIHGLGMPMVVSPIIYSRHSAGTVRALRTVFEAVQRKGKGFWHDYAIAAGVCRWADRVVPNTGAEAELVEEGLGIPAKKITMIPNGVEERFAEATPDLFVKTYGLRDFVLNVGHIGHRRKNVLALIRALAGIDHPAVIIGRFISGTYGEACRTEAARHPHIHLIDGVDHDSPLLASAYAACRTFVLPSLFETPGIAALEAGLAGARVVITPHGGTKEYFGDHAIYVEPTSITSIREGIEKSLDAPGDGKLQAHVRAHYLWQEVARLTAEVYRSLP
jgi:glycosyltransferase involved in cell wall biosynthesis